MTDAPERTPPERIWLQPHMGHRIDEWTWCVDRIEDDTDIEYVLASKVAALEQERDYNAQTRDNWKGEALRKKAEVERLRAAIREAREFLRQPGPVGINTFHLMLDGILKDALTKPKGE